MRIKLTITEGPYQGTAFEFNAHDTFIVGRSKRAHFQVPQGDRFFSRNHFLVEINPPHCRLMDLSSRNGTRVNGARVAAVDLKDGDLVKAGRTVFRAAIVQDAAPPACDVATVYPATAPPVVPAAVAPTRVYLRAACPACTVPVAPGAEPLCPDCAAVAQARPQLIAGYRSVSELGRGGMGVVELAVRTADGVAVALKTIMPQRAGTPADVGRFLREAAVLRTLDHPHIVAFRDVGECAGRMYIAMDYVRGTTASRLLKEHPDGMPVGRAVALMCQLLGALDYAHAKGFVHRDLKPANLLVTDAVPEQLKLADFGLARVYQTASFSGLTMQGDHGGTYPFMPPEQITHFRDARPANDIYSVGATLYNLLTGRYVYDFPDAIDARVLMLLQDDPVPIRTRRPHLPAALAAVIHRALAREPGDRFADAREMKEALAPFRPASDGRKR